jgi:E3 ubiquitin-protein ligase MYCBP2
MEFPIDSPLQKEMYKNMILFDDIKRRSLERLKFEGLDKSDRITNPESAFFNKPLEFAIGTYAYYQCFKCKKPYFGGA